MHAMRVALLRPLRWFRPRTSSRLPWYTVIYIYIYNLCVCFNVGVCFIYICICICIYIYSATNIALLLGRILLGLTLLMHEALSAPSELTCDLWPLEISVQGARICQEKLVQKYKFY